MIKTRNEVIDSITTNGKLNMELVKDTYGSKKKALKALVNASEYYMCKPTEMQTLEWLTSKTLTKNDIGKIVILNNNVTDCNEWVVSRVNEDNTVDLFPRYVINDHIKFGDTNIYKDSHLREWLNGEFLNGFSDDVKNAMKVQSFLSNGETLNDKVKCPSLNEVGLTASYYLLYEGTMYPIFSSSLIDGTNPLSKYTTTNGSAAYYWTRSLDTGNSYTVWIVYPDGFRDSIYDNYHYSLGAVACIRF